MFNRINDWIGVKFNSKPLDWLKFVSFWTFVSMILLTGAGYLAYLIIFFLRGS